ncbi:uncharacterized protein At4g02000-like [Carya illinoinensis]|uniref:uncharacterized protein At4g02000-like n=1 Tax=Carya illinoinensis TaxID=32201 RepID=UPI001C71CF33|nr:uncharacterized protein At4g02000-like [Carya illinoinensis]
MGVRTTMEGIEEKWKQFNLTEEEDVTLDSPNGEREDVQQKGDRSLIGKVCTERGVGRDVIAKTMARIWRISKRAIFQEVERNVFVITFATHADKQRIMEGRPWLFDNALILLAHYDGALQPGAIKFNYETFWMQVHNLPLGYMTEEWGMQIGNSVGRTLEVDVENDGIGWGKCLRVRVEIPLCKAIARGRFIRVKGQKEWVHFRYEKLPKICFLCGWLVHGEGGCTGEKGD